VPCKTEKKHRNPEKEKKNSTVASRTKVNYAQCFTTSFLSAGLPGKPDLTIQLTQSSANLI